MCTDKKKNKKQINDFVLKLSKHTTYIDFDDFSLLDLKSILLRFNSKKILIYILFLICFGMVMWQINNCVHIFVAQPTTTAVELVNSQNTPLAFTFCKTLYESRYKGNFSSEMHKSIKSILVHSKDSVEKLFEEKEFSFEFVSFIEKQLMCKEFVLPSHQIDRIEVIRGKEDNNLFLFIHQPGMFYLEELVGDYPNEHFNVDSLYEDNENAKIQINSFDFTTDPHMTCTSASYDKCIRKEVIQIYNKTMGCTYPIQRYILLFYKYSQVFECKFMSLQNISSIFRDMFGVKICQSDEIVLLKNITKTALKSQVCLLPCTLNYVELEILPGTVISI